MNTYKLDCWYRYRCGDEKDFAEVVVKADSIDNATIIAKNTDVGRFCIIFQVILKEINGVPYDKNKA